MSGGRFVVVLEQEQAEKLKARALQASTPHDVAVLVERLMEALQGEKPVYAEPPAKAKR